MTSPVASSNASALIEERSLADEPAWTAIAVSVSVYFLPVILFLLMAMPAVKNIWPLLRSRVSAYRYLFSGPAMIQDRFLQAMGKPFEIRAPDTRYVFVSSEEHIKEVDKAPDTILSMMAASRQMIQPVYTMHGFSWFNRRDIEGYGFSRALRTLLVNHLPDLLPKLGDAMRQRLDQQLEGLPWTNGSKHIQIAPAITKLIVYANALTVFGPDLADDEDFMGSALEFIEETLICAELIRLVPSFLAPAVGALVGWRLNTHKKIFSTVLPLAEHRCRERDIALAEGATVPRHSDCIQWVIETSPQDNPWAPKRIVHELMAIWFGSVHGLATTTTFAIHDLCLHPEYLSPLRREADLHYPAFERAGGSNLLPLLDSFLKESARLSPIEAQSTRRCVTGDAPFVLSDGTRLDPGDWACTPAGALMRSGDNFPRPDEFSGFRFAGKREVEGALGDMMGMGVGEEGAELRGRAEQPKPSGIVDVDNKAWHMWGTGRVTCPGRYYATAIMKVILAQIIMKYDLKLKDPEAQRFFTWRSSTLPLKSATVVFTARDRGVGRLGV